MAADQQPHNGEDDDTGAPWSPLFHMAVMLGIVGACGVVVFVAGCYIASLL